MRLCLQAGTAAIEAMLVSDAEQLCGKRYQRHVDRQAYRWGLIGSEIGWHGGKAAASAIIAIDMRIVFPPKFFGLKRLLPF
jgi:hypothetical protein